MVCTPLAFIRGVLGWPNPVGFRCQQQLSRPPFLSTVLGICIILFFKQHDKEKCLQLGITEEDLPGVNILHDLLTENERGAGSGPFTELRPRSRRAPPPMDSTNIDVFQQVVNKEIEKLTSFRQQFTSNLTESEVGALMRLEKDELLIVKPSDKGGNLVLLDHLKYKRMTLDILEDRDSYCILDRDPTEIFRLELENILIKALDDNLISENEFKFILPTTPQIPTFYTLPKIHKGLDPLKGRPIVSGINSITQNAGVYIDKVLRPFVLSLPSYLRDSSDLLTKLDDLSIDEGTTLASIDVEALYSSIPHKWGLNAVSYYLKTRGLQFERHNTFVLELTEFILHHNYFVFNHKYYHQLRGTAMGSPCAPSYANLFLGWWEDTVVFSDEMSHWSNHITLWNRFIDDVLVLWVGTADDFSRFVGDSIC